MDKSRTEKLIGKENVEKIASKHITVIGVGGVGGSACMMLVRGGVEKLRIVDFDDVSSSNINRQVVAYQSTIGKKKVEVLKEILKQINPLIEIEVFDERLTKDNVSKLVCDSDIVVDAIDSVEDKVNLISYCKRNDIKIVSAMGAGNRFDYPKFEVVDIYKTHDDGLAKVLRKKLRIEKVENLDVVLSTSKPSHVEGVVGSISYYPIACGAVIASYVINKIIQEEL